MVDAFNCSDANDPGLDEKNETTNEEEEDGWRGVAIVGKDERVEEDTTFRNVEEEDSFGGYGENSDDGVSEAGTDREKDGAAGC